MRSSIVVSPDDECQLCGETRENHGDSNHEFSVDGSLVPKKRPEPGKPAPQEKDPNRPAKPSGVEELEKAFLRLNEVLLSKGVLDGRDLIQILGGPTS